MGLTTADTSKEHLSSLRPYFAKLNKVHYCSTFQRAFPGNEKQSAECIASVQFRQQAVYKPEGEEDRSLRG